MTSLGLLLLSTASISLSGVLMPVFVVSAIVQGVQTLVS